MLTIRLSFVFFFILAAKLHAQTGFQQGDIILLELSCMSCQYIALETKSRFSHSGLVVGHDNGELRVLESLVEVRDVALDEFLSRRKQGSKALIMRSNQFQVLLQSPLWTHYRDYWKGLPFDEDFLWDNHQIQTGREKLYCSEFITKFLSTYLTHIPGAPRPMDFSLFIDFWRRYFQGDPPQGELGNNPSSFEHDPHWFEAFEY